MLETLEQHNNDLVSKADIENGGWRDNLVSYGVPESKECIEECFAQLIKGLLAYFVHLPKAQCY